MTPTDDQLARFVAVSVYGPDWTAREMAIVTVLLSVDTARDVWLARHRAFCERATSDFEAAA